MHHNQCLNLDHYHCYLTTTYRSFYFCVLDLVKATFLMDVLGRIIICRRDALGLRCLAVHTWIGPDARVLDRTINKLATYFRQKYIASLL